eukprot:TRINITY_DN810_c0_g4_i1.p1 TRINITY_DN810_c0_g4~~TRINITY_DN810_c0_g4_i1.p1  ORF type:complete len:282 (-),score=49.28 TRINITY_DN810_c0_g4_i1:49-894(-)
MKLKYLFCVLAILLVRVNGESAASIQITENAKNTVIVQSGSLKCLFRYDTNDAAKEKPPEVEIKDGKQIIQDYTNQGACFSLNVSPFVYEFCFGKEITQTIDGGDVYSLGKFVGYGDDKKPPVRQFFQNGTPCDARSFAPRTAVTEFTCSSSPRIVLVAEPRVCEYKIVIGIPEACSHPHFSEIVAQGFETWFVEISQYTDGTAQCSAYNNGMDQSGTIVFYDWSISLEGGDSFQVKEYDVLYNNRKKLPNSMINVKKNGISKTKSSQSRSLEVLTVKYSK